MKKAGKWAFFAGLAIAVVGGLGVVDVDWFPWLLAVLGLVVGILNITSSETQGFLLGAIALMVTSSVMGGVPYVGVALTGVLSNIAAFVGGAALVVSLMAVYEMAKD